jgi:hypothetical protein
MEKNLQEIAKALAVSAERTVTALTGEELFGAPKARSVDLITWYGKMKVFGWEKFHCPTYISVIHFYKDKERLRAQRSAGLMLLYVERGEARRMLNSMGLEVRGEDINYDAVDSPGDRLLADGCGELCNIIAGAFKTELCGFGYPELLLSPPLNFINDVPEGLPYNQKSLFKYEISLPIGEREIICIDVLIPVL